MTREEVMQLALDVGKDLRQHGRLAGLHSILVLRDPNTGVVGWVSTMPMAQVEETLQFVISGTAWEAGKATDDRVH